jgi:DNA-binding MarR family transcriptional regulator
LEELGYLKRSIDPENARAIAVSLSALGERRAVEIVKTYARLQRLIDAIADEKRAEDANRSLLAVAATLRG